MTQDAKPASRSKKSEHETQENGLLPDPEFMRRIFVIALIVALTAAIYRLSDVLLLAFGGVLVAIVLRTAGDLVARLTGIKEPWSLLVAGLFITFLLMVTIWAFGPRLVTELQFLAERIPVLSKQVADSLGKPSISEVIGSTPIGGIASGLLSWSTAAFAGAASLVLVVFGGIYIAIEPRTYRTGFLKILPPSWRPSVGATLEDADVALRRWISAQVLAMGIVGVLTGLGLWIVGVPSAFALGLIAGLAEFVPYVGPFVSAILALLLATSQGLNTMIAALAVVVLIQQLESNLIMPLLTREALAVPPATAVFAVVAMGVLFGPLGLLLGFPLTVVVDIAIRRLYVRETLGESVRISAEEMKSE